MSINLDNVHRGPMDASPSGNGAWVCQICSVEQPMEATYCPMCLYARPMDRRGVPQIFAGYAIHFNGIIPRTIVHPSHSVEWRMAERHGAVCITKFDPAAVNLLVYRPGYERSEKCRACVDQYINIPPVPITWVLDSLLQSRQIHPSLYRLNSIPAVANPTVRGTDLPHHQHPYYRLNFKEYSIPTSFPPTKKNHAGSGVANKISLQNAGLLLDGNINLPPFFDIEPLQFTNVNVYDAAVACAAGKNKSDVDEENDEIEARGSRPGIELIASQQSQNKVDKMLFSGMAVVLSPALMQQGNVKQAMQRCGAKLIKPDENIEHALRNEATHVIYAHEDKKCDLAIVAAHMRSTELPGLQMAQSNWVEDCLLMGELIPLYGMYVPTAKLMETLKKKYDKQRN